MATYESNRYAFTGALVTSLQSPNMADGTVSNTEFQRLDGVTADIQTQIDSKLGGSGGTFTGNVTFADGIDLKFGSGTELLIESDGSNGKLVGNSIKFQATDGEDLARLTANNAVQLFYDNTERLSTTSIGANTSGTHTATTFSGSGASLTSIPAANLTGTYAALNGGSITSINASNVASGTLANARLPSSISVSNVAGTLSGNGSSITNLNASNLATGTVPAARLPGSLGKVLKMEVFSNQTQFSTNSNIPADGSTPTISEGIQVATRTFTPTASNSTLVHMLNVFTGGNSGEALSSFSIFRGNTNIGSFADITGDSGHFKTVMGQTTESAATTSSITYTIRFGTQSNQVYWNRASGTNGFTGTNPNNSSLRWIIYEIGA